MRMSQKHINITMYTVLAIIMIGAVIVAISEDNTGTKTEQYSYNLPDNWGKEPVSKPVKNVTEKKPKANNVQVAKIPLGVMQEKSKGSSRPSIKIPVLPAIQITEVSNRLPAVQYQTPVKEANEKPELIVGALDALAHCHKGEVATYATILDITVDVYEPEQILPGLTLVEVKKYVGQEALEQCRVGNWSSWTIKLLDACRVCPINRIDPVFTEEELRGYVDKLIQGYRSASKEFVEEGAEDANYMAAARFNLDSTPIVVKQATDSHEEAMLFDIFASLPGEDTNRGALFKYAF